MQTRKLFTVLLSALAVLLLVLVLREYRKAGESSKTTAVAK